MSAKPHLRKMEVMKAKLEGGAKGTTVHVSYLIPTKLHRALKRIVLKREEATGEHVSLSSLATEALTALAKSEGELAERE